MKIVKYPFVVLLGILVQSTVVVAQGTGTRPNSADEQRSAGDLAGFIQKHCVKCHGKQQQHNDVRLDQLDPRITDHASLTKWQDVLDVLNTGEMPPEDQKQPKKDRLTAAIGLITDNISSARKRLAATGGVIRMRHLTKREYIGSMKDLFGDDVPQDILPDDVSGGFDTNGSEQYFSLKQYENFYQAGKEIVHRNVQSLISPLPEPSPLRYDPEILPFENAKAQYLQMVKVMELIDAGAPPAEIAKVNPKVADAGQVRLFKQRFEKRIVKPKTQYESLKGKEGLPGGFAYSVDVRPRSLYWQHTTTERNLPSFSVNSAGPTPCRKPIRYATSVERPMQVRRFAAVSPDSGPDFTTTAAKHFASSARRRRIQSDSKEPL